MNKRRVLIVDDEPLARKAMALALAEFTEIEIIGECSDGFDAVKEINKEKPDVVFLDIQMPKLDGFDVLELLENPPFIVFVTAYNEYALKAFETHALDYILKPVKSERLGKTLERVEKRLREHKRQPVSQLLDQYQQHNIPLERILLRDRNRIHILQVEEIAYVEAQDDYVAFYTKERSHLKKETLSGLEKRLDSRRFVRIHRSYLLNIDYLSKIEPFAKDSKIAVLKDGKTLPVSRSGYQLLLILL
ncbi:MAG: LytTR family transcriptional regulator DNA-binding domain-containing protein [Candidatus Aminicenantes bacterium]|nr:LytTR family transcriptional regulator DNA-binding domain-containing protein [Candidatus Aminicenantes bacterium]